MVAVAHDMWRANTAREVSGSPYFAHQEIIVDLKDWVAILRSVVFGAASTFLMKSAPSSDVSARLYQLVAASLAGAGIIGR